jgi:hypothetical protein
LAVIGLTVAAYNLAAPRLYGDVSRSVNDTVVGGRKTVTVYADNEASASAQAANDNPGWTVVKVKKVNKDPKSRAYQVTLTK